MKPIRVLAILALIIANTNLLTANTAEEVRQPLIGAKVPSVEVANQQGGPVDLMEILRGRSSVVIFYRGSWCPYCNTQLSELASIEDDLIKRGYQIVAISPDKPESLDITDVKHNLGYQLLSDSEHKAMDAFGVSYENKKRGKLPVPSVFLVTPELEISFQYVNPNYKYRISSDLLLAAANAKEH